MRLTTSVHGTESLVTVSGAVGDSDVTDLRTHVLDILDQNTGDLLLDMRGVGAMDALRLIPALVVARSRAKFLRHRIIVIDDLDGEMTLTMRRHGIQFRIPVYPDAASASAGLADDRATRGRLTLGAPALTPSTDAGARERPGPAHRWNQMLQAAADVALPSRGYRP